MRLARVPKGVMLEDVTYHKPSQRAQNEHNCHQQEECLPCVHIWLLLLLLQSMNLLDVLGREDGFNELLNLRAICQQL